MRVLISSGRLVCVLFIWAAIVNGIVAKWGNPAFALSNYFSYFTNISNLFASAVLLAGVVRNGRPASRTVDRLRAAATVYLLVTGIVYALLLAPIDAVTHATPTFNNWVLHRVMPTAMVADWLIEPPRTRIRLREAWVLLLFPILYVGYTLVRGALVGWYPYPFLDPQSNGYRFVVEHLLLITGGSIPLIAGIVWLGAPVDARTTHRGADATRTRGADSDAPT
ncbi:Pr6Pr family membrane protein [Trinickia mobilis]|uniref:Pr6Pr family membrane protein n=1 Tax=Trinickia mobilis TaxID=2816356 RepID=UPI001A8E294F|nr:Pr6Pr family membrane protein [Trinickia mobilis]